MNKPLVSVIIRTCFARRGCLREAIESVMLQTHQNIEVVIVENGSEGLFDWLKEFNWSDNCKMSYYQLDEANRCLAGNLGMEKSKGGMLCFLDDDDQFYPKHISVLFHALDSHRNVVASYAIAHELPSIIQSYTPFKCNDGERYIVFGKNFSRGALFVNNYMPIQTVLFRKSLFEKFGGFDVALENLEDWNLWAKYASLHDFILISEVTSVYRVPSRLVDMRVRDEKLDAFYSLARNKQRDIKIHLNCCLLTEIIKEIMRSQRIMNIFLSFFLLHSVKNTAAYKNFCESRNVSLSQESTASNVLEAIELANSIVMESRFLWFMFRAEAFFKSKLELSRMKRIFRIMVKKR